MASSIEEWPPEIIESMLQHLTFDEMCNLRLANKTLAVLVAQETFKRHYRTKHVEMSPEGLAELVRMTESGCLGNEIENLVLVGLAVDVSHLEHIIEEGARWVTDGNGPMFVSEAHELDQEELAKAQADLAGLQVRKAELGEFHQSDHVEKASDLLSKAFGRVCSNGKHRKLPSLKLEVAAFREDVRTKVSPIEARCQERVWSTAEILLRTVMMAFGRSGVPLESLDVFTGQWACSLSYTALDIARTIRSLAGLPMSLRGLNSLSLSLSADLKSTPVMQGRGKPRVSLPSEETQNLEALAAMLDLCEQLEHLHVHWYRMTGPQTQEQTCQRVLQAAFGQQSLRGLRSLTLRGVRCGTESLLQLLQEAPIVDLRLENVRLAEYCDTTNNELTSHWQRIFDYCSTATPSMESLFFDDLVGRVVLYFQNVPGRPKYPRRPSVRGCPTLDRKGEQTKLRIQYVEPGGRALGSPAAYRYRVNKRREYGPL